MNLLIAILRSSGVINLSIIIELNCDSYMNKEREESLVVKKRQKSHALFQLQLNKCDNISEKDKLLIKAHLADSNTSIVNIFESFNSYKCYKRLEKQLKEYLSNLKTAEKCRKANGLKEKLELQTETIRKQQLSQNSSPKYQFTRKKSLVLDVGLLRQQTQLRNALSPCNMKPKNSNDEKMRVIHTARTNQQAKKLSKAYSITKFNSQKNQNHEIYTPPFCQQQIDHPQFMKLFLMNKIKHEKQLNKLRQDIQQQKENNNCQNQQESIFSFEIFSKVPEKEPTKRNVQKRKAKLEKINKKDKPSEQISGKFYQRIRQIIDSQYRA